MQEAYHTIEDIHGVIITSKVQPPPQLMANFYEKLAQIFWVSQYYLFHANALYKFYEITREIKKDISKEELEQYEALVI
jgi:translation initiation factor 3 subunit A